MGGQGRIKGSKNKIGRPLTLKVGEIHGVWEILDHDGLRVGSTGTTYNYWTCKCLKCGVLTTRSTTTLKGIFSKGCRCMWVVPDASFHRAFRTYKRQAKTRSLSFELTLEDFKKLVTQNCYYCGQEPELNSYSSDSKIRIPMNGIDRDNSSLAYTKENCFPCCGMCNLAKLDYTKEKFLNWIHRVADYQRLNTPDEPGWLAELEEEAA